MKALVLNGPKDFKYNENWPTPEPKEGHAIVKVKYSGICGSDLPRMMITGAYNHPHICGHEFMGYIQTPTPNSTKFKQGDKVAVFPLIPCKKCNACLKKEYFHCKSYDFLGSRSNGGFAEYCLVPEENLFLLPENIDEKIGAFIEPLSVALHFVKHSGFKQGNTALVFGAGAIGLLTAMLLKEFGAKEVTIVSRSEASLNTARKAGFENVIGINSNEFKQLLDSISESNFDYCFEAAGSNQAINQAIEITKNKGTIAIIGRDTKDLHIPLKTFEKGMRKEITIKCCWGYEIDKDFLYNLLSENKIDISPLITKEIDLSQGEEQIKKMFNKEEYYCKVLFKIKDNEENQ